MGSEKKPTNPRCSAHSKQTGKQCGRTAIPGGTVCRYHGGLAPQVQRKAAERLADLIDPDRALRELARLAYADLRELVDEQGKLLPMKDWPDDIARAVSSVKVRKENLTAGDGEQEDVVEVKLWDKGKMLTALLQHLGLLKEKTEVSGELRIKWGEGHE
jgi:hypothetical protein